MDSETPASGRDRSLSRGDANVKKVHRALRWVGNDVLANRIAQCLPRARCSSFYCEYCRNRAAKSLEAKLHRRIETEMRRTESLVQERLRFVTVLHDVVLFDAGSVRSSVEMCRVEMNAFHRAFPDVWIRGAFEFELIDLEHLLRKSNTKGIKKRNTLSAMLAGSSLPAGLKILVHFHATMDLGDRNGSEVLDWMQSRWDKHRSQVDIKATHAGQKLQDKIWKISSYCFKNRFRFNDTFETRDYEMGKEFTNEQLGSLISLYQDFLDAGSGTIRGLNISHG